MQHTEKLQHHGMGSGDFIPFGPVDINVSAPLPSASRRSPRRQIEDPPQKKADEGDLVGIMGWDKLEVSQCSQSSST
jgi:hypothetical protein